MTKKMKAFPGPQYKVILGRILNPLSDHKCEYWPQGALVLKSSAEDASRYKLTYVGSVSQLPSLKNSLKEGVEVIDYGLDLILPGLYDLHFHWVQDHVRLKGKASLLTWLKKYAWPAELRFKKTSYSKAQAQVFFQRLSQVGTIGGGCYSSVHEGALVAAMEMAQGQFVIGNVLMTMNSPQYLSQTKAQAKKLLSQLARRYGHRYAVTPRFAPTTHPEVMQWGAQMSRRYGCFIQTHLAETQEEIQFVLDHFRQLPGFEKVQSYTEIYQKVGLLGKRTIMGHGIYLSSSELKLLGKTQTAVAHCPSSNAPIQMGGLGSGLCDFRALEKFGIPWALGSDIGAGPYLSMFDVMETFVRLQSKHNPRGVSYVKALYRSTLAGAQVLGLGKNYGNLVPGKWADFIVVKAPTHKKGQKAEEVLKSLLKVGRKNRQIYDGLVWATYLSGKAIYEEGT